MPTEAAVLPSKGPANHAFLGLDLMRGIAAVVIAVGHAEVFFGFHPGSGYLAVDLFFALSGFVLAHAYDRRIALGMSWTEFMRIRLIRLYPLYLLGLLGAALSITVGFYISPHGNWTPAKLALSLPFALGFLPTPPNIAPRDAIFPLNVPAWSLAFELLINLAFVGVWKGLSKRVLIVTVMVGAVLLIVAAAHYGSLGVGSQWSNLLGGFARVTFSFAVGVLLLRMHRDNSWRLNLGTAIPILVMLAALCFNPALQMRPAYDVSCVVLVFPLLVLAGASAKPNRFAPVCAFLGATSYAVYALHFPLFETSVALLSKLTHGNLEPLRLWAGSAFIALVLIIAYAADVLYDAPLRKYLSGLISKRPKRPEAKPQQYDVLPRRTVDGE